MENNYHQNEEIEQFLRDELKEQKMYPSEHVWENIRTEIHGNTSWPALTFIALFIIMALTISTIYNYPPKKFIVNSNNTFVQKLTTTQNISSSAVNNEINTINSDETLQKQMDPNNYTAKTFAVINNTNAGTFTPAANQSLIVNDNIAVTKPPAIIEPNKQIISNSVLLINKTNYQNNELTVFDNSNEDLSLHSNVTSSTPQSNDEVKVLRNKNKNKKALLYDAVTTVNHNDDNPLEENYLKDFGFEAVKNKRQQSKWEMQFYLTPSISYRKLEDDKIRLNYLPVTASSTAINVPLALNSLSSSININNAVHHTPALGMELGAGLLYSLTPGFKLRTGLQFNIRQYYIDASQSFGIATFAIVQNNHLDSVNIFATLGNSANGFNTTKIDTKLYQISIPIGFQWDFVRGKKLGVSAGASIQPTFTLNKNVFMISTDYKYYANGASFFRKWNLNTSIDLNITYKTGDVKWYFGPQIRYQHLPTYTDIYPIKEYRWDYGLKIGLTIPINK